MLAARVVAILAVRPNTTPRYARRSAPVSTLSAAAAATAAAASHTSEQQHEYMRLALTQAAEAADDGEVPIGAVIVDGGGAVLAAARNRVEGTLDASAHAEMLCLREAARATSAWRLLGSTLYVTVEPCPMCLAAMHAFRVERLVYGAPNPRLGAIRGEMAMPLDHPYHTIQMEGGVLADECAQIMLDFFKRRRSEALESGNPGCD